MKLVNALQAAASLLLLTTQPIAAQNDDQAQAKLLLYEVEDGGTFTCEDEGARCDYVISHFKSIDVDGGQDTANEEKGITTWAALKPTEDSLILGECALAGSTCYVQCNARCKCTTPEGSDCMTAVSRPPSTAPPTPTPVPEVCNFKSHTEHCAELMPVVPAGNKFECYNFCGGIFISSCSFQGDQCGALTCTNSTPGTVNGVVLGCTDADRVEVKGTGKSGAVTTKLGKSIFITLVASVAWFGM